MESEKQHIRIRAVLEVIGKPKEYIENQLKEYIDKIKQDDSLMILNEKISPVVEKDSIWSTFAEIEVIIKGISNLIGFCIDYMPSSIDILKPDKFEYEERIFTQFVNDVLAKLHKVDMITKEVGSENTILKQNMNRLIKNNILILAKFNVNKIEGMSKAIGIESKDLKPFISQLIEDKKIKEENGDYFIA